MEGIQDGRLEGLKVGTLVGLTVGSIDGACKADCGTAEEMKESHSWPLKVGMYTTTVSPRTTVKLNDPSASEEEVVSFPLPSTRLTLIAEKGHTMLLVFNGSNTIFPNIVTDELSVKLMVASVRCWKDSF